MALPDYNEINAGIRDWQRRSLAAIKAEARREGIRHRADSPSPDNSITAIKVKDKAARGDLISAITFTFRRSLIYPYFGAGKGMGGKKGSAWYDSKGNRKKTNPRSLGKAGTGSRGAKPFFNAVDEKAINELAGIVTQKTGDVITANIFGQQKTGKI